MGFITVNVGSGLGPDQGNCLTNYIGGGAGSTISCNSAPDIGNVVHELFHAFDKRYQGLSTIDNGQCAGGADCLASNYYPYEWVGDPHYQTGGYKCAGIQCIAHPPDPKYGVYDSSEAFANLGQNWVLDATNIDPTHSGFAQNQYGDDLRNWMNEWMPIFIQRMGY
jgi:hypothetical protein